MGYILPPLEMFFFGAGASFLFARGYFRNTPEVRNEKNALLKGLSKSSAYTLGIMVAISLLRRALDVNLDAMTPAYSVVTALALVVGMHLAWEESKKRVKELK